MAKKKKKKAPNFKELTILKESYLLLRDDVESNNIDANVPGGKEFLRLFNKLVNVLIVYEDKYKEVVNRKINSAIKGLDEKKRNGDYSHFVVGLTLLEHYKYAFKNKEAGKALFAGIDIEKITKEMVEDLKKKNLYTEEYIQASFDMGEALFNRMVSL